MSIGYFFKTVGMILIAGFLCFLTVFGYSSFEKKQLSMLGLRWSRQLVTQMESLTTCATERGESDPLRWASKLLATGAENRPLNITVVGLPSLGFGEEHYSLEGSSGSFQYLKVLRLKDRLGIKIMIQFGYHGFLGAPKPWLSDLFVGLNFLVFFYFLKRSNFRQSRSGSKKNVRKGADTSQKILKIEACLGGWIPKARSGLLDLGTHVRDVTREATNLIAATSNARKQLQDLSRVSSNLRDLSTSLFASEAKVSQEHSANLNQLKHQADRLTVLTSQAVESFNDVSKVTQKLNQGISNSTQDLLRQARLVQTLKDEAINEKLNL